MAIVSRLEKIVLERNSKHTEVDCAYSIIEEDNGVKLLQIDTYGSKSREVKGKKSQSIRFDPDAIEQLKQVLNKF